MKSSGTYLKQSGAFVLNGPHREGRQVTGEAAAGGRPWFKGGGTGWLVIGALAVAWDLTAPETLSAAFHRARSRPVGSAVVVVLWAYLTCHLFQLIPDHADPSRALVITARKALKRSG
jgi:hypothetical protein